MAASGWHHAADQLLRRHRLNPAVIAVITPANARLVKWYNGSFVMISWGFDSLSGHHSSSHLTDISAFYVLTGQVTYRMTYNQSPHIRVRSGIYHFVRRVPADLQQHYRSDRVSISLRTKSARAASRSAVSISQRLDDYWHGLRLQKMDVPALHLAIDDEADVPDNSPTMMEAVDTYLRLKADKQTPTFIRAAKRNGRYVAEALGNRPITSYLSLIHISEPTRPY